MRRSRFLAGWLLGTALLAAVAAPARADGEPQQTYSLAIQKSLTEERTEFGVAAESTRGTTLVVTPQPALQIGRAHV